MQTTPVARLFPVVAALMIGFVAVTSPALAEGPQGGQGRAVAAPTGSLEELLAPIAEDRLFRTSQVGLQVVNVRTGEEVFARNPDRDLIPASTMKVLTAAVALRELGPSYRFSTDFYVDDDVKMDAKGVLEGSLYIRGHGDPTLELETLFKMVNDLKLAGLTEIDGDVVYDEGFLDVNYLIPGWEKESDLENGPSYFPTLGALSVNNNLVGFVVGPGGEVGKSARIGLEVPASSYIEIENKVLTTAKGTRRTLRIEREVNEDDHTLKFTLTGTMPMDSGTERYRRAVVDPTAHFMAAMEEILKNNGITVKGKHVRGGAPAKGQLFYAHRSAALSSILAEMNKQSNNFIAEQVLRTVGAETQGLPGTTEGGIKTIQAYLDSLGVGSNMAKLRNGSGLTRESTIQPSVFTAVLVDMSNNQRVGSEFKASLAIAGQDGTLWRRLSEDPGRLRGKTGTIDGVHCLVGYLEAADGQVYAFSFMVNGIRGDASVVKRLHDRFARRMFSSGTPTPEVVQGTEAGDDGED